MSWSTVVNKRHDEYDVYIGRPSKWGNPFPMKAEDDRVDVVTKYARHLVADDKLMDSLNELKGQRLACFCAPKLCHGDVLANAAEFEEKEALKYPCQWESAGLIRNITAYFEYEVIPEWYDDYHNKYRKEDELKYLQELYYGTDDDGLVICRHTFATPDYDKKTYVKFDDIGRVWAGFVPDYISPEEAENGQIGWRRFFSLSNLAKMMKDFRN